MWMHGKEQGKIWAGPYRTPALTQAGGLIQGDHIGPPLEGPSHSSTMSLSRVVVTGSTRLQEKVFNATFHQIAKKTQHPQSGRHCHRLNLFPVSAVGRAGLVTAVAVPYVELSISALSHPHKARLSLSKTNSPPCQLCFAPSTVHTHVPQVPPILGRSALFLSFLATYTAPAATITALA